MANRNVYLFHFALVVLCFLSQTDARPVEEITKIPILARQVLPPICRPRSLEPAIDCGCFIYYPLYARDSEWQFLEDICLEELSGRIRQGERRCSDSPYGRGFGSSIRGSAFDQITNRASTFFRDARRQCTHFEAPTSSTYSVITNGGQTTSSSNSSSESNISFASFTAGSRASHHKSSLAPIFRDDVHSGLPGEGIVRGSKPSLESAILLRKIKYGASRRLVDFCFTTLFYKRYPRHVQEKVCRAKNKSGK